MRMIIPYIVVIMTFETLLEDLKYDMVTLLKWFKENSIKANPKNFDL